MTEDEKRLLGHIQKYAINKQRLEEREERLRSKSYKITPSYSQSGGGGGNGSKSRVEDFAEQAIKLKKEAAEYRRKMREAEIAMNAPSLTKIEKEILEWIAIGGRPKAYAEAKGIYPSRIYKIRDGALRKAVRHLKTRYEGNLR